MAGNKSGHSPKKQPNLLSQGHVYVDVRSEPEFEAGHPEGALNVPLLNAGPVGLVENPDFLKVMESAFGKDEPLVIGCKAGGRSKRAAAMLAQAGFSQLSDQVAGFDAGKDAFGRPLAGWRPNARASGRQRQTRGTGLCRRERPSAATLKYRNECRNGRLRCARALSRSLGM